MKDLLAKHFESIFEMSVLVFIYILGSIMLAYFPQNDQLASWISGGAIIGVLARAFSTKNGKQE